MMVADTDVLIDYLGGHNPAADRIALELAHGQLTTTAVSRFEMLAGVRSARQDKLIRDLLAALATLPLDERAADAAARVRRTLEKSGAVIGMGDSLIAGIVLANHGALLTRNRRHFERIEGLTLSVLGS